MSTVCATIIYATPALVLVGRAAHRMVIELPEPLITRAMQNIVAMKSASDIQVTGCANAMVPTIRAYKISIRPERNHTVMLI